MRKSLLRSVCAALAVVMLVVGACAWGADKRRGKRYSDSPVEAQLTLVETLLKVRVPPIRYSLDGSLNRSLDQLEHQLRESGVKLKFVRQAGESDFEAPLSGAKFKYEGSTPGGSCAEVLEILCHEAACAYCVRGGEVHVFKASTEPVKQIRTMPQVFIDRYFHRSDKLKLRKALVASRARGRAEMTYDDELYVLTMQGNRRNLYLANQMLNNLYHEWRRLPEAVKDGAPSVRTKRYKFERQLEQRQVVPVVFEAGCSLEDYMRYLALHTASGRIKTPVKFEVDGGKADEVTIEQALDFSYMTVREALELVCDSCGGHYRLKGSRVTIVPRELETRTYKVTYDALRAFSLGRKPKDWKEQRAKADKTAITDERALAALKEARIHFPSTGVVSYDAKQYTLEVHTSQQGFRNLDALHIYLVLMQDK